ncbi:uncharacterized protein SPSK_10797 [Sporothrix schenckii 1099-18]|uniref:Uncharacterized protein n=1 Tax=Sporothrix schenckii 1099-18 TaxID=1397361 RepID=A0A0F2MH15_SPOSC|nr:uncharacterized protein SPSK_10797 [Sporothrix schenckii 1099-18]KJR88369.1 hypothetical protein SPSK_10797 [Sporothrix schenckii 1099-18]
MSESPEAWAGRSCNTHHNMTWHEASQDLLITAIYRPQSALNEGLCTLDETIDGLATVVKRSTFLQCEQVSEIPRVKRWCKQSSEPFKCQQKWAAEVAASRRVRRPTHGPDPTRRYFSSSNARRKQLLDAKADMGGNKGRGLSTLTGI